MANILILQEEPAWEDALSKCLQPHHEIEIVDRSSDAVLKLQQHRFDLVITRVHFKTNNMFEFLRLLKKDPQTKDVPIVCFCGLRTRTANLAHVAIKQASYVLGATKFLSIEDFCTKANTCDLERMRAEIESVIET